MKKHKEVLLIQSWWVEQIFLGAARYAKNAGWRLDSQMRWSNQLPDLLHWQGDGIIAFVGESAPHASALDFIKKANVPVVDLGAYGNFLQAPQVTLDDAAIGSCAAEHFYSLGLREFAFVELPHNPSQARRKSGFMERLASWGCTGRNIPFAKFESELPKLPRPTGIFSTHDLVADKIISMCTRAGYQIPEEFAILGCNDTEILCDWARVPLSSVNCNQDECGYQAAALLDGLMRGEPAPVAPKLIRPRGVTIRTSTDMIAIKDLPTARALGYIRRNFAQNISITDIVRHAGVSIRTMQNSFMTHVGHTMSDEIVRLRIELAKKLLQSPNIKVQTIGFDVGLQNRSHFVRLFKKYTGLVPSEYRRQHLSRFNGRACSS